MVMHRDEKEIYFHSTAKGVIDGFLQSGSCDVIQVFTETDAINPS